MELNPKYGRLYEALHYGMLNLRYAETFICKFLKPGSPFKTAALFYTSKIVRAIENAGVEILAASFGGKACANSENAGGATPISLGASTLASCGSGVFCAISGKGIGVIGGVIAGDSRSGKLTNGPLCGKAR